MFPWLWILQAGLAGDALSVEAVRVVQEGGALPSVTVYSDVDGELDISLSCAGRAHTDHVTAHPGLTHTVPVSGLPRGIHSCVGAIRLTEPSGARGEMPLRFDVEVRAPMALTVDPSTLDLDAHRLVLDSDRPMSRVTLDVVGPAHEVLGHVELGVPHQTRTALEWSSPPDGEILRLDLTVWDDHELRSRLELSPWWYAIPHQDVVFETARAEIRDAEVPKLERAWRELTSVRERYGDVVRMQLFVAGYTDTVGDSASNRLLSERRARAIGDWFRTRGFAAPIWIQGFGERAPAIATPDETDEPLNRRAVYVVAAQPPPVSAELPSGRWTRIP